LRAKAWREVTWLEGTRGALLSRFVLLEVEVENAHPNEPTGRRPPVEWPAGEEEPTHYTLVTLPASAGLLELVRMTKARRRVGRTYEDVKGELGLGRDEGRTRVGRQHHLGAVFACDVLVVACQRRAFFASTAGARAAGGLEGAG
jgi:SRSO17 transposase